MRKRLFFGLLLTMAAIGVLAVPAGAQELIDAGQEGDGSGGLAFVAMAIMVFIIGFALFFMDRIRRRAGDPD